MGDKRKDMFNNEPGFFGRKLDHEAPIVVCDCMAFIRNKGLYDVGVFRVSGSQDVVNVLKKRYDETFPNKEAKETNQTSILNSQEPLPTVNDVASLMKAFFKDLDGPLIPADCTEQLVVACREENEQVQLKEMSKIVKKIPSPNRECLGFLISFLREICTFKKFNQMSADNLATCFVLSVMGGGDAMDQLYLLGNGAIVLKKLITKNVKLYMPAVANVKKNTKYKDLEASTQPVVPQSKPAVTPGPVGSGFASPPQEGDDGATEILTSQAVKEKRKKKKHEGLPEPKYVPTNGGSFSGPSSSPSPFPAATNTFVVPPPTQNTNPITGSPRRATESGVGNTNVTMSAIARNKKGKTSGKKYDKKGDKVRVKNPQPMDAFPAFTPNNGGGAATPTSDDAFPDLAPPNTFKKPERPKRDPYGGPPDF